jgi:hypothetical protein
VDSSVTDSPETENPGIGFVSQSTPPAGYEPTHVHPALPVAAAAPRYTVISDSNSPIRPWLK